jgi:acetolactate synthase small subunit
MSLSDAGPITRRKRDELGEFGMTGTTHEPHRWLFRATVVDKAGAMTSIASAFSNRGVSIDSIVAHGAQETPGATGSVVITFRCGEAEKEKLRRELQRLSKVIELDEHVYLQDYLREGAVLLVKPDPKAFELVENNYAVMWDLIKNESIGRTYFVAGAPNQVDPLVDDLLEAELLADIVYAIITI